MSVVIDGSNGVDIGAGNLTFPDNTTQTTAPTSIGVGQTWQAFTSPTRAVGTTYTNNTAKPIMVNVFVNDPGAVQTNAFVDSVTVASNYGVSTGGYSGSTLSFIVPVGSTYRVAGTAATTWAELR